MTCIQNPWRHKALTLAIVEIAGIEAFVLSRQVVGDEIDDYFQAFCVDACHQLLEILHRTQIEVDSAIVGDGIRRARTAFGNVRMSADGLGGVLEDAGQPDMGEAHVFQSIQGSLVNVVEGAAAVFSLAAIEVKIGLLVTEQAWKKLINVHTAKV